MSPEIINFPHEANKNFNNNCIRFAFIGGIRYKSLLSIADAITRKFSNHEFHFYGFISPVISEEELPKIVISFIMEVLKVQMIFLKYTQMLT